MDIKTRIDICLFQTIDMADRSFETYDVAGLGKYGTYAVTIHSYTTSTNLTDYTINCTTDEDGESVFDVIGVTHRTSHEFHKIIYFGKIKTKQTFFYNKNT